MSATRLLLTRGTEWGRDFKGLRNWRILEMNDRPHLLTCRKRAEMPACLTPIEAASVVLKHYPGTESYMWDEPNYLPGPALKTRTAVRIVAAVCHRRLGA